MSIDLTIDEGVAEIVLNNPAKLNALDESALAELSAAYVDAAAAGVRALVLRGEGRAFCVGRDISDVDPRDDDAADYLGRIVTPLLRTIDEFPAPTFAMATGACLGVGLGLLIASDVVYVADTARIGSPFANIGAVLDSGGHSLFFARLGAHRALDLIYTAELMTGEEAVAAGLFSRVVPEGDLASFTMERARRVAHGPTDSFLASKHLVRRLRDEGMGLWRSVEHENAVQGQLSNTADYLEGFLAFQEKRKPSFGRR